jgi:hypothetical protein
MESVVFVIVILASPLISLDAWQQYAELLEFPQKKDSVYVFEMNIDQELAMSYLDESGHMHLAFINSM